MMIKITNEIIESFDPCEDGINNFNSLYPNYKNSLSNLLQLEDIKYEDKIWLVCRVVGIKILQQWSVECAEMVVDNYNKIYPDDSRISDCIESTKRYILGECNLDELNAAIYAARSTDYAARSADCAARSAAWSATSSVRSAARSAAWSATEKEKKDLNLSILIALLENQ